MDSVWATFVLGVLNSEEECKRELTGGRELEKEKERLVESRRKKVKSTRDNEVGDISLRLRQPWEKEYPLEMLQVKQLINLCAESHFHH